MSATTTQLITEAADDNMTTNAPKTTHEPHTTLTNLLTSPAPIPANYTVQEIFGYSSQMQLPGYQSGHPLVPQSLDNYVWSPGLAKDCIEWLCDPDPEPLWVSGPTSWLMEIRSLPLGRCVISDRTIFDLVK